MTVSCGLELATESYHYQCLLKPFVFTFTFVSVCVSKVCKVCLFRHLREGTQFQMLSSRPQTKFSSCTLVNNRLNNQRLKGIFSISGPVLFQSLFLQIAPPHTGLKEGLCYINIYIFSKQPNIIFINLMV